MLQKESDSRLKEKRRNSWFSYVSFLAWLICHRFPSEVASACWPSAPYKLLLCQHRHLTDYTHCNSWPCTGHDAIGSASAELRH